MIKFLRGLFERSRFSRNTTPKIISILFAVVLWLYVMGEVNPETVKVLNNVQVQLLNEEELRNSGLIIIDQEDFTVNMRIAGRRNEILQLEKDDIKVSADLRGFQQGVNSIPLEVSQPVNLSIEEIQPQQIKVRLDKIVQRQKPVQITIDGTPTSGYEKGDLVVTPSEVLVEGPESRVNSVTKVVGEIDISDKTENVRTDVPVKAVDSDEKEAIGVEVKTKYVNAYLPILKVKNVEVIPQVIGEVKDGYKITNIDVQPKVIRLKGREDILESINNINTQTINIDEIDQTLVTDVNLILPAQVETPSLGKLPKITIEVEKIESKEFIFNATEISINNLDDEFTTNIGQLDQDINVKISDVRSTLADIKRNDLEPVIDAGKIEGEGTYNVEIKINKSIAFESIEIIPNKIDIEVSKKENYDDLDIANYNGNNNTQPQ